MSAADPIGIYSEQTAKREALVARLSPAARHQAFPRLYARPVPIAHAEVQALNRKVVDLTAQNTIQAKTIATLQRTVADLQTKLQSSVMGEAIRQTQRTIPAKDVIDVFLRFYSKQIDEEITIETLASHHRHRTYSAPRHICIWLVRQLSTHLSLPQIGKLFGGRDHTTCLHACERAPYWMVVNPSLKAAVDATLLHFGVSGESAETDRAGAP